MVQFTWWCTDCIVVLVVVGLGAAVAVISEEALPGRVLALVVQDEALRAGFTVLAVVEVLPHQDVQVGAAEVQDLLEGLPEVTIQGGVDDGVQEGVGVA